MGEEREEEAATVALIRRSAAELRAHMEAHHQLLMSAMDGDADADCGICACPHCPHQEQLKEVLHHTIKVLEGTRKAFKSRQLEKLRKQLLGVLADKA